MRKTWNPTRRNRNIGTSKQGHGSSNKLVIPTKNSGNKIYWERLQNPVSAIRKIKDQTITFLVEPTYPNFVHACTIDDLVKILEKIPIEYLEYINLIVLRQPKRKEIIISPAWGHLAYWSTIGCHSGRAIYIEAQEPNKIMKWSRKLVPSDNKELERLHKDGHQISLKKNHYAISYTIDSIRSTQLYRTLLHEIGHLADYIINVETGDEESWLKRFNLYHAKSSDEKEAFAHRFADELSSKLSLEGYIPFEKLIDIESMKEEGLDIEWFQENKNLDCL